MILISAYAKEQYQFVRESRQVLFDYCKTISPDDFVNENTAFGNGGSMRSLLVHVANTYEAWIAKLVLKKNIPFSKTEAHSNIDEVIKLYDAVDVFMDEFIECLDELPREFDLESNATEKTATPFKIFTHVLTHEYHHKGQILTLSRLLGFVPVDTDVLR